MSNQGTCVIIGASHAGVNAAFSLRKEGYEGPVILIDKEATLPYHRPPLSKAYLSADGPAKEQLLKSEKAYEDEKITLRLGCEVQEIGRHEKKVILDQSEQVSYDHLILAVGGRPFIPPINGIREIDDIYYLRNLSDAMLIRDFTSRPEVERIVIIGGGYIGLEIAASLRKKGKEVVILEREERLLARVASEETSSFFEDLHGRNGVNVALGKNVEEIHRKGNLIHVKCSDGSRYEANGVIIGVGIRVNDTLAQEAGLNVENGVLTDAYLRTNDPSIYAIGDCSNHMNTRYRRRLRLESVQNAVDQAKVVAANICGRQQAYDSLPWFWSDQYDVKLQIVGLSTGYDQVKVRQDGDSYSVWYFKDDQLLAVDAMSDGKAYVLGMKALKEDRKIRMVAIENIDLPLHPSTLFEH